MFITELKFDRKFLYIIVCSLFKSRQNLFFNMLPHVIVDRVSRILKRAVWPFATWHGHEHSLRAIYDLESADNKSIIKCDIGESFQFPTVLH